MPIRFVPTSYKVRKLGKIACSCLLGMLGTSFVPISMIGAGGSAFADTVVIDGAGGSGFLIGTGVGSSANPLSVGGGLNAALGRYEGGSLQVTTSVDDVTVFTNFSSRGGNGSGGGAGLGGVFFVDQGAVLQLKDVVFSGNVVRGGDGGSDPAVRLGNKQVVLQPKSLDLIEIDQQLATPLIFKDGSGNYGFQYVDVSTTGADLLALGSPVTFDTLDTPETTVVSQVTGGQQVIVNPSDVNDQVTVRGDTVKLGSVVNIGANDVANVAVSYVADSTPLDGQDDRVFGYTVNGTEISFANASDAQVEALEDSAKNGSVVFLGNTRTTITDISYDADGKMSKLTVADDVSGASGQLDIISISSFKLKQFTLQDNTISVKSGQSGFEVGMQLFDSDGNPLNSTITSVSDDGSSFDVDDPTGLAGVNAFEARKSPIVSGSEIEVSSGLIDSFYEGASVYFSDIDETAIVASVVNDGVSAPKIVLAAPVTDLTTLQQRVAAGDEIGVELRNVKSASGSSITLYAAGLNLQNGMILQGSGIEEGTVITSVSSVDADGFVTIGISSSVAAGSVSAIVAKSALSKGGAMNSLVSAGSAGDGGNGFNKNGFSSFFNGGEGQEGTRGYAGDDGDGGTGGDGGYGGNGSDGMPINPDAIRTLKSTTSAFLSATGELAAAVFPDPVAGLAVPIPDPLEIATKTFKFAGKSLDFATAVYENVQWGINLSRGIAGMGGDGGEGGEGGGGDEFFGGGSGGAGGAGGEGALAFTDGGNGGDGGRGGNGGFGAGGGAGGAGGDGGSTGAADGGDPGDGGFGGFAAGDGSNGDGLYGGGGSGFGGAIFVRETGTLLVSGDAHFQRNTALGGSSNNLGAAGDGAGAAIFMMKGSSVTLAPGEGSTITFDDDIADDSAATYEGAPFAEGAGADLIIHANGGLVELNVENSYSGDTILRGATLSAVLGEGVNDASRVVFDGAGELGNTALDRNGTGTLLITENFTDRRVGNEYGIKWSGSGGFAAAPDYVAGLSVVLGEYLPGEGQVLSWGQDGFFENNAGEVLDQNGNSEAKVLTFGSEFSTGFVNFVNDVLIPVGQSASVAVYNTGVQGSDTAILSGDWSGAELKLGNAAAGTEFDGTVYMTGTNALNRVQVLGGTVSTYNPLDPTVTGTLFGLTADLIVAENATLRLYGSEELSSASVNSGGTLVVNAGLTAVDISNQGFMSVADTATVASSGTTSNGGVLSQLSNMSADGDVINDGWWSVGDNLSLEISGGLTGEGDFCLETAGDNLLACSGLSENAVATQLNLTQASDSTFNGIFKGTGSLDKSGEGDLELTASQEFVGGLTISAGSLSTTGVAGMADELAVLVKAAGAYDIGVADTFGSLDNAGDVRLRADAVITNGLVNKGEVFLFGDRQLKLSTLTGSGAIKGDTGSEDFTLNQSGNSEYSGTLSDVTDFHKTGSGVLTLTGANSYSGTAYVDDGELIVGASAAMNANNMYEVASGASLVVNSTDGEAVGNAITVRSGGELSILSATTLQTLVNAGSTSSTADVGATSLINDGTWNVLQNQKATTVALTGSGTFSLQTVDATATTLELAQTGDSQFNGTFTGAGNLTKSGNGTLTLSSAQTFTGELSVNSGRVITTGTATLADDVSVMVGTNGHLSLNVSDTIKNLDSYGTLDLNEKITVSSLDVLDGITYVNDDLTVQMDTESLNVEDPGQLVIADDVSVALSGGLSGDGDIQLVDDAEIELGAGTISTFSGTFSETQAGSINSTLTITGGGELRLTRADTSSAEKSVLVDYLDIQNGAIGLDGSQLLSDDISVNIASSGDLVLIDDESGAPRFENINELTGAGDIYLNANTLNINSGGSFEGTFFGDGSVNVQDGQFTINNSLSSSDGTLEVSSDDGTTVAAGTTVDVAQINVNQNSILNVSGSDDGAGQSVVRASGLVVHTTSTLHLGSNPVYADGHEDHSVIDATWVLINGSYTGNGTISSSTIDVTADATMTGNAIVSPGNSPGIQVFDAELVTFGDNSELRIEIDDNSLDAGMGFDQIVMSAGTEWKIEDGAELSILSGLNADYSVGTLTNFASFDANAITGSFSSVTNDSALEVDEFAVNLATGTIVGLIDTNGSTIDLVSLAVTENQKAMIEGMEVKNRAGAKQYYGGTFIEDLTVAVAGNEDKTDVFNRASPESYAAVVGAAELATSQILPKWKGSYALGADKTEFFTNFSSDEWASGDQTKGDLEFGASSNVGTVGYVMGSDFGSVMLSVGKTGANVYGDYISGKSNGAAFGIATVFNHNDRFSTNIGISASDLSFDGKRSTNNGKVEFTDVGVLANEITVGAEYSPELRTGALSLSAAVAFGTVNTPSFTEIGSQSNALSAMDVVASKNDFTRLDVGLKYASPVAGDDSVFVEVNASMHSNPEINLEGSYDNGQANFGVKSDGFKQSQVSAGIGYQMSVTESSVASFKVGSTKDWKGQDTATASFGLRINF